MNKEQFAGKWQQLKGKIKSTYGDLTDDEIETYNGKQDQFFGTVKERYGIAKEKVQEQMSKWESELDDTSSDASNRAA
jgi:uncharacterized protein YjbJ (UPF0337 family)